MKLLKELKNFKISGQTMSWTINGLSDKKTLADYLKENVNFSSRLIKLAKSADALLSVNGKHRTVRYQVKEHDQITIRFPNEAINTSLKATKLPLDIIYEDDHLIVFNKKAGQVTVPSVNQRENSLSNAILYYYKVNNLPYTVHIVTRLDRDTSGLVLVAKHQYAHSLLAQLQMQGKITRKYTGFITGKLNEKKSTIDAPIGRSSHSIIEREVTKLGDKAITHYEVIKEYDDYSYVQINLETGRTHQIRVHFAYLGHPLVGDDLYGMKSNYIKRQALHSEKLEFTHPITQKKLHLHASLPKDLLKLFDKKS